MRNDNLLLLAMVFLQLYTVSGLSAAITRTGTTGLVNTPSTELIAPGGSNAALQLHFPDGDNVFSLKGAFGYGERTEIAIGRSFSSGDQTNYDVTFSPKYLLKPNIALGGVFDFSTGMQDSVYLITGFPENGVYLGAGANFGSSSEKRSHFGSYEADGKVRPLFFLFGAQFDVEPQLKAMLDYDGNQFAFALRYRMDHLITIEAGLNSKTFNKDDQEFFFGVQFNPEK